MISRLIPIIALGCALVALFPAPASAQADPPCPASIRPVAGGLGDATSNGYDDGDRGTGEAWVGGQLILRFTAGTTQREAICAVRELGGAVVSGGIGSKGLAGVPDTMLVQLDPGISLTRTDALLARSSYRDLIKNAMPNLIMESQASPDVNDPLFSYQWGLSNQRIVPQGGVGIGMAPQTVDVPWTAVLPGQRFSMRIRQAWSLLKKRTVAGVMNPNPFPRIQLAIVDDSLFEHDDLIANTDVGAGRAFNNGGGHGGLVVIYARQGTWNLRFGADAAGQPLESCDLPWNVTAQELQTAINKGAPALCGNAGTTTYEVTIDGDGGTFRLTYGDPTRPAYETFDTNPLSFAADGDQVAAALRSMVDTINSELPGANVDEPITAAHVTLTRASTPRVYRITIPSPPNGTVLGIDAGAVTNANGGAGTRVVAVRPSTVTPLPQLPPWAPTASSAFQIQRTPFAGSADVALAARPADAADYVPNGTTVTRAPAGYNGWPGRQGGTGTHGQNIAGMIGATADNNVGMTGVLGKYHNVKMVGLVGMSFSDAALAAALRYASDIGVHVANVSIGGGARAPAWPDWGAADPLQQGAMQAAMSHVPLDSKTLFVIAASNYGGNTNDPGPRDTGPNQNRTPRYENGNVIGFQNVATNPCRPKGMNIRVRPMRGGEPQDAGGTLSLLQMPDGTYDRGNILCVGAVNWLGKLSPFTQWGRGVIDVAAPGENIIGTSDGNGYDAGNGTSYAAPYAAAIAAMVNTVYPNAQPWLVKCAILSSATSKPLPRQSFADKPLVNYTQGAGPGQFGPNGEAFTVNGMVQASEAISAAGSLISRVAAAQSGQGTWPTCVQKRRTFLGVNLSWRNTPVQ